MSHTYILVFPGQGSQSCGMCKDITAEFLEAKLTFEEASDTLGFDMKKLCFEDPEAQLSLTQYTQSSILTVSTAIFRILQKQAEIPFNVVAGHSLGEYSALVALGAFDFSVALKAVYFRGQAMQRAVPVGVGSMAAYLGPKVNEIPDLCHSLSQPDSIVEVVNFNSSGQLVLSGHKDAVERCCLAIAEKKLGKAIRLPVSAPFHSSLMKPAALEMETQLNQVPLKSFNKGIIANVDAKFYDENSYNKKMLVQQIASPVLWTQTLSTMEKLMNNTPWSMIEVGPGRVLQGLVNKTLPDVECHTTNNLESLNRCLQLHQ